jgi:UDPglucose--hexose-1-phosphate uridylyltransferase
VNEPRPEPEVRIDQLTGLRTILAPARADRPIEFKPASTPEEKPSRPCPFCEGNEEKTPPEAWADRPGGGPAGSPGWRVRAVPNLYPPVAPAGRPDPEDSPESPPSDPLRASARGGEPDLFTSVPAHGVAEVIVHTPKHLTSLSELDEGELALALDGWRTRMRTHADSSSYMQLFVNEGGGAGASLEHTHAQLYVLDFVPVAVARERERFTAYNQRTMGGDLLADIASEEVRRRDRLVAIDDEALVVCPWASHSPFELRMIPRHPAARFERDGEVGVGALAAALRALRARFGDGLELNIGVRTAPRDAELFHWHIDLFPRLAIKAGFELSTGVDVNTYPPERAAAELREALK